MDAEARPRRLLLLAEGHSDDAHYGKTALGVLRYARDAVVAVVDSERAGSSLDGVPVVATVDEALAYDPTVALVGVATSGGRFPASWQVLLRECAAAGLDLESGLHERLSADPELVEIASRHGVELRDLRVPPEGLSVPTGANLAHSARVVLTVGTDCAIGKMTVALELDREARRRGIRSAFVPTGQTGIAIAGWGISVDAVIADFIAGASERLVVEAVERGTDLVVVEGQGSLLHPAYAGVTLGLLHGSAPHDLVLCHRAGQTLVDGDERFPIPPLVEVAELYERAALIARRPQVRAIALNTRGLDDAAAHGAVDAAEAATGLPATDPVRFGAGRLLDALDIRTHVR